VRSGRLDLERLVIVLIAAHSYGVGLLLMVAPAWAARFAGWGEARPLFFLVQAGVFHLVLATGYLLEHWNHRGVTLLVMAKTTAVVFLVGATVVAEVPWAVPVSGVADGVMGLAAWLVHRRFSSQHA